MKPRRWVALVLIAGAVALLVAHEASQFYAGYRWYRAMGALSLWETRLETIFVLRVLGGTGIGLFAFANFYAVRQSVVSLVLPRRIGNFDFGEEVSSRSLTGVALLLAALVAVALAFSLNDWSGFLLARAGIPFGETDPFFNLDLGFYTYQLPFETALFTWITTSVLCVTAVVVFLYVLTPGLRLEGGRLHISEYIRRHLAVLGGVVVLLLAWHFRLELYGVLIDGSGPNGAFGAVDHHVRIPGNLVLAIVTLAAGLVVVWAGWTGQRRLVLAALAGILVTGIGARDIAPLLATRFPSEPDSTLRERPYAATRAGYTRRAYGVDQIVDGDSNDVYPTLGDAAIGVSAWDAVPLAQAIEAESRLGRGARTSWVNRQGGLVGVVTTPQPPPDPGEAAPLGITVRALASAADDRGAPVRLPQAASDDDASLLAPSIVLDSTEGYAIVPDSAGRVRGVPLTSPLERIAEGLSIRNLRLWTQEMPEPRPVLVTVRNARDRVEALAPFFAQGSRVTPLVAGDSLYWVIDLYAASSSYPLSQAYILAGETRSYFHHAATALVLSSTGGVQLVADSTLDPIAATWVREFPSLFAARDAVAPGVLADLPPAADAARARALAFGRYGARSGGGSPSHPPVLDGADSTLAGSMPAFALPHGSATAYEIPLVDDAEHLHGILVAEGGPNHRTVWLEASPDNRPRWNVVLDRLAEADSAARTPNQPVVRGVVRAFLVGGRPVYTQPFYRWTPGAVPQLLHVAYMTGDSAATAPTLRRAMGVVLPSSPDARQTPAEIHRTMLQLYETMRDALRRSDWVEFGKAFDALGALLARPVP